MLELCIDVNQFSKSLETGDLPRSMTLLIVAENNFSGSFSIKDLPPLIEHININKNQFSGKLELSYLPDHVVYFFARYNRFTGEIDVADISGSPVVDLRDNKITQVKGEKQGLHVKGNPCTEDNNS